MDSMVIDWYIPLFFIYVYVFCHMKARAISLMLKSAPGGLRTAEAMPPTTAATKATGRRRAGAAAAAEVVAALAVVGAATPAVAAAVNAAAAATGVAAVVVSVEITGSDSRT